MNSLKLFFFPVCVVIYVLSYIPILYIKKVIMRDLRVMVSISAIIGATYCL